MFSAWLPVGFSLVGRLRFMPHIIRTMVILQLVQFAELLNISSAGALKLDACLFLGTLPKP